MGKEKFVFLKVYLSQSDFKLVKREAKKRDLTISNYTRYLVILYGLRS
jgi:hypothetical protein